MLEIQHQQKKQGKREKEKGMQKGREKKEEREGSTRRVKVERKR
jgi:hypothetical protein